MKDSSVSEDRLVIAFEGVSLKKKLPEIRQGTEIPFYFQILDFEPAPISAWTIRQRETVNLKFADDVNKCTKPATCPDPDADDEDGAESF